MENTMRTIKMMIVPVVAMVFLAGATAADAQMMGHGSSMMGQKSDQQMMGSSNMPMMQQHNGMMNGNPIMQLIDLGLSDQQISALIVTHAQFMKEQVADLRKKAKLGKTLTEIRSSINPDTNQLRSTLKAEAEVDANLETRRIEFQKSAKDILTSEQQERLGNQKISLLGYGCGQMGMMNSSMMGGQMHQGMMGGQMQGGMMNGQKGGSKMNSSSSN